MKSLISILSRAILITTVVNIFAFQSSAVAKAVSPSSMIMGASSHYNNSKNAILLEEQFVQTEPWNTFLGGSGDDKSYSLTKDENGNLYVAGYSSITWGNPIRAFSARTDGFVAKLDMSGNLIWNTFLGGLSLDDIQAITVDNTGNIYVVGDSGDTWGNPLQAHSSESYEDFIAKLDTSGNLLWHTFIGSYSGAGIAVDNDGNIFVNSSSQDIYPGSSSFVSATKLDSSGTLIWQTLLGDPESYGYGIALDESGDVYLTGYSSYTWGNPINPYTGAIDAFVAKVDNSTGTLLWNTFVGGGDGRDVGYGIVLDSNSNIYVTGHSTAPWGSPVRAYEGDQDGIVVKLDSSGTLLWNTFLGGVGTDFTGYDIELDGDGNIYVGGGSNATWGTPIQAYLSDHDAIVTKLNSAGELMANTFLGGIGVDKSYGIVLEENGDILVSGYSSSIWGNPVRPYTDINDAFVVRISLERPPVQYTISGNTSLAGVTLGSSAGTTISNENGDYSLAVPKGWSGTVLPYKGGYQFTPGGRDYANVQSNQSAQDYTHATIVYRTISGNVGVGGANLIYTDGNVLRTVTANSNGDYTITISMGWSGTVTPFKANVSFFPLNRDYSDIQVNTSGQNYSATLMVINNNDSGYGSLRQAIADALSGATIRFHPALVGQPIELHTQIPVIKDLIIDGSDLNPRVIISGGGANRIFEIGSKSVNVNVTLDSLVLKNGKTEGTNYGGAMVVWHESQLTINNVSFRENISSRGGVIQVYGFAKVKIFDSEFISNSSTGLGGAIYLQTPLDLTVTRTKFNDNSANSGGAVYLEASGRGVFEGNIFESNTATTSGGAISSSNVPGVALTVKSNLFSNNYSGSGGGAIAIGRYSSTFVSIENNTFFGNQTEGTGGAIASGTQLDLFNNTFSHNEAAMGGASLSITTVVVNRFYNNILANSVNGSECYASRLVGSITGSRNIVADGSGPCSNIPGTIVSDPMIGPLSDNGGPTQTMSLLPGSPAIDSGDNENCLSTDQRGVARPYGAACDIGAFELEYELPIGTTTTISCASPVTYGSSSTCTATVRRAFGINTPTGTVSWTSADGGAFTSSPCTLSGIDSSVSCSVTYSPSAVGDGAHRITATYSGDTNFSGSSGSQTITVNTKELVPTITASNKVYNGTTIAAILTRSVSGAVGADAVSLTGGTATFGDKNVGNGKTVTGSGFSLSGAQAGNYHLSPTTATTTANITPRGLTVSATGVDKVYDGTTTATVTLSTNALAGDTVTASYTSASFLTPGAGTGKTVSVSGISIGGADVVNYILLNTAATTTATITPRGLMVTATGMDKVYDGTTSATVSLTTNALSGDVVTAAYTSSSFASPGSGTGKTVSVSGISIGGADVVNYTLLNTVASTTADITPKPVTVTSDDQSKLAGEPDPDFTYTSSGFVGADTFTTAPTCSVPAPHDEPGTYDIVCSGGNAGTNYTLDYVKGTLTVNSPVCYILTLAHTGQGSDPIATPAHSTGCPTGKYVAGASVNLSGAVPASGWHIAGWSGTEDDASIASTNTVTIPAGDHAAAVIYLQTAPKLSTLKSIAAQDGWVLESSETSNMGGTVDRIATTLYLGDNAQRKQYRSILSFSTKGLPDDAVITKVTLKVKKQGIVGGGNPANAFQGFIVDVKKGFLGPAAGLQVSDFQAGANKSYGPFKPALSGGWYTLDLTPAKAYLNRLDTNGGVTQLRLRLKLDDNNNAIDNVLKLYSGGAPEASRPQLIIEYYVP